MEAFFTMNKKTDSQRRRFIKQGLFGLAGVVSAPAILKSKDQENNQTNKTNTGTKLITRPLGKTGITLPIVSFGAGNFDLSLYKTAIDRGVKHLDTSPYYSNGKHERVVGEALKSRSRDSLIVATSQLLGKETTAVTMGLKDAATLTSRLERSLKNLNTDYTDIYYIGGIHSKEQLENPVILSQLEKLKKSGKIRFAGIATHNNEAETIEAVVKQGFYEVILTAYNFRQGHRDKMKQALAEASKAGIGIIAMKTMAGAFWDKAKEQPINCKAALKWALRDGCVHTSVPAIKSMEQLEANLSIMEQLPLTPEEKTDLKLGDKLSLNGLYCQQCGECHDACPYSLEIPVLMRSYMYAYGYNDMSKARNTMAEADLSRMKCSGCTSCPVNCSMGFNVPEKVLDIARLKDVPQEFLA